MEITPTIDYFGPYLEYYIHRHNIFKRTQSGLYPDEVNQDSGMPPKSGSQIW